jgi:homoserine kinase
VIAWAAAGSVRRARLEPLPDLIPVLCVPAAPLATEAVRRVLPATVPHADAAWNAARAALLVASLTGDARNLFDATEDFLHQPYRASSMPASAGLLAALRAANVPAVVSGAGPAVLALLVPRVTPGPEVVTAIAAAAVDEWSVKVLEVDRVGAAVEATGLACFRQASRDVGAQVGRLEFGRGEHSDRVIRALVDDAEEHVPG